MVGLARHEAGEGGADLGGLQGSGVDAELHRHGTHHAGDFFVFDAERGFAGVDGDDDTAESVAFASGGCGGGSRCWFIEASDDAGGAVLIGDEDLIGAGYRDDRGEAAGRSEERGRGVTIKRGGPELGALLPDGDGATWGAGGDGLFAEGEAMFGCARASEEDRAIALPERGEGIARGDKRASVHGASFERPGALPKFGGGAKWSGTGRTDGAPHIAGAVEVVAPHDAEVAAGVEAGGGLAARADRPGGGAVNDFVGTPGGAVIDGFGGAELHRAGAKIEPEGEKPTVWS